MPARNLARPVALLVLGALGLGSPLLLVWGGEKRAPAPKFSAESTRDVFFDSIDDAFLGDRPTLQSLRKKKPARGPVLASAADEPNSGGTGPWDKLISATSLEDEIKRVKLQYDSVVTQPGPFKSGGFEQARLNLMILGSLFAIISEYGGDVRWKRDAAVARDLLGRTAFNCNAGTNQVFNEARARKDDLQDLMTGTGLRDRKVEGEIDWASITDRGPMMEYAEALKESLREAANSEAGIKAAPNEVRRPAELLAALGRILIQPGMDDSENEDYVKRSVEMTNASLAVQAGLERKDFGEVGKAVGAVTQSCDACHNDFR